MSEMKQQVAKKMLEKLGNIDTDNIESITISLVLSGSNMDTKRKSKRKKFMDDEEEMEDEETDDYEEEDESDETSSEKYDENGKKK